MRKIILHVGLEKTGTTYLQNVFSLNRQSLVNSGVHYPETGLEDGHHYWFAKALGFNFEHEIYDRGRLVGIKENMLKELEQSHCQSVLISSEHFDFNASRLACGHVKDFFSGFDVSVVIFLRNQIDYAQSLYVEHIKWGGQETFKEFLDTCGKFNFLEKVSLWRQAGFDVRVADYDSCKQDILKSFLKIAGISIDATILDLPSVRKNVSPPIDFIELVRQLNITTDKKTRRARYAALNEQLARSNSKLRTVFNKREWGFPVSAWSIVECWERQNQELALSLGVSSSSFLGGSVIERFNELKQFDPPNLSTFLLSDFPSRLLKQPASKRFFNFWSK